jgi:hypothetical protein
MTDTVITLGNRAAVPISPKTPSIDHLCVMTEP